MFARLTQRVRSSVANALSRTISSEEFLLARRDGALPVESRFLSGLRLPNRVYKTTSASRLADSHPLVVSALDGLGGGVVRVLDAGCSSGVSTAELHQVLQRHYPKVETVGTDLVLRATLVENFAVKCLFMGRRDLVQIENEKWSIRWPPRRTDWALRPARALWAAALVASQGKAYRACCSAPQAGFRTRTIPLTSSATESVPGLLLIEEDILHPSELGTFHLVRAANLLNRVYFSPSVLQDMAASLWNRVAPGGLLLVLRSDGQRNRGTLFARAEGDARITARLGGGSEIEEIVLEASRQARRSSPATA